MHHVLIANRFGILSGEIKKAVEKVDPGEKLFVTGDMNG